MRRIAWPGHGSSPMLEAFAAARHRLSGATLVLLAVSYCDGRGHEPSSAVGSEEGGAPSDGGGADSAISADASAYDSGPESPMQSCVPGGPGMTNCGPGGNGTESCCTTLEVIGGSYYRTYDLGDGGYPLPPADGGPTGEGDPATVSTFRLDKYDVTVGRFRQFVSAWNAGWHPVVGSGKHAYLNSGNGLNATKGGYEPGWIAAYDEGVAPTDTNLSCDPAFPTWTSVAGGHENSESVCHLWMLLPERARGQWT
jgi:sulfatase modifying factor 1